MASRSSTVEDGPISKPVTKKVHSRVGLLGNPSDGFGGATISFSLANFWAEVTATPSDQVVIAPNPLHDRLSFGSITGLSAHVGGFGYHGGTRLLMAACHRFARYAHDKRLALPEVTFALSYETCIPRQSGLSGSSAIVLAALQCLAEIHGLADRDLSPHDLPFLALEAEQDLGITAGLQDRVIQTYGGCVYMDFSGPGRPRYHAIRPDWLPTLYVIYDAQPSGKDSGRVHSTVKERWEHADEAVRKGMRELAELAGEGRDAISEERDCKTLCRLMRRNYALRRELYGEAALGARSMRMVEIADSVGATAKFAGSGGAVIVYCPSSLVGKLEEACHREGFCCVLAKIGDPEREVPIIGDVDR